jgi:hypothetical protein
MNRKIEPRFIAHRIDEYQLWVCGDTFPGRGLDDHPISKLLRIQDLRASSLRMRMLVVLRVQASVDPGSRRDSRSMYSST